MINGRKTRNPQLIISSLKEISSTTKEKEIAAEKRSKPEKFPKLIERIARQSARKENNYWNLKSIINARIKPKIGKTSAQAQETVI